MPLPSDFHFIKLFYVILVLSDVHPEVPYTSVHHVNKSQRL